MKKFIGVILCCLLIMTAYGKSDESKSSSENSEINVSSEATTSTTVEKLTTESTSLSELTSIDRSDIFGLNWNDSIDLVKDRMNSYINTFEESNVGDVEGATVKTGLGYIDVDFLGEVCDVTFRFNDYKLHDMSFSYIWGENKTMSPEEWTEIISEKFGEYSLLEGSDHAYIWKGVYNGTTDITLSWWDYGIVFDFVDVSEPLAEGSGNIISDDDSENMIKMYSDIATVKQQMLSYELISEEETVDTSNNPQTLLTYEYILQNGSECELRFCFQSVGLIGVNFLFPETMYEGVTLFDNIYDNLSKQYGEATEFDEFSGGYRYANWTNSPYGEGSSLYLARFEDLKVQFSYWADENSNENQDKISSVDISTLPITDYSFFTDDPNLISVKEYSDIDVDSIPKSDLDTINSLINTMRVNEAYSSSFGQVILKMCLDFDITYQRSNIDDSIYLVKYSGRYLPNPDAPEIIEKGSVTLKVDVESNTCKLHKGGEMYQSMNTYAVLY